MEDLLEGLPHPVDYDLAVCEGHVGRARHRAVVVLTLLRREWRAGELPVPHGYAVALHGAVEDPQVVGPNLVSEPPGTAVNHDDDLANVNVVLGVIPRYNLYHLIRKQKTLAEILVETSYGIKIIAGASGFSKIANLSEEERKDFIAELAALSNADVLIIDCAAGVSNNVISFIAAADDALIVTTPEPTAITDAYGIIKIIATEIDNLDLGLKLVVNRVKSVVEGKKVAERVITIAGQFLNLKVDYLGFVYDDPVVHSSVVRQKPFLIYDPKAKASVCIRHLLGRLEHFDYRDGKGVPVFLKKLFGGGK